MKMKKTLIIALILVFCVSLGIGLVGCGGGSNQQPAEDAVFVLRLDNTDPEGAFTSQGMRKWAEEIREASNGRLQIEIYYSSALGAPRDIYTNLLSGVSDIAFIATPLLPGTFPLTEGAILPRLGAANNISAGLALQMLFEENAEMQEEMKNVRVLGMFTNECYIPISNGPNISELSAWNGVRARAAGTIQSNFVNKLGGVATSIPTGETYEAYNKRIVDVVLWNWSSTISFGLVEDTVYVVPDILGYAPIFMPMNLNAYQRLPDDLKAILDAHSGQHLSEIIGTTWYGGAVEAAGRVEEAGIQIVNATPELLAAFQRANDELEADYIADMASRGLDGAAFLSRLKELIQETNIRFPNNFYDEYLATRG